MLTVMQSVPSFKPHDTLLRVVRASRHDVIRLLLVDVICAHALWTALCTSILIVHAWQKLPK